MIYEEKDVVKIYRAITKIPLRPESAPTPASSFKFDKLRNNRTVEKSVEIMSNKHLKEERCNISIIIYQIRNMDTILTHDTCLQFTKV